jgi:hypothetical protein
MGVRRGNPRVFMHSKINLVEIFAYLACSVLFSLSPYITATALRDS